MTIYTTDILVKQMAKQVEQLKATIRALDDKIEDMHDAHVKAALDHAALTRWVAERFMYSGVAVPMKIVEMYIKPTNNKPTFCHKSG